MEPASTAPPAKVVCPNCGAPSSDPSDVPGYRYCQSCGNTWHFLATPGSETARPSTSTAGKRRSHKGLFALVVVLAGAGAAAFFVLRTSSGPDYPKQWDARVAPIAARVEQLRGLDFEHPVKVNYLSDKDFEKKLTTSPDEIKKQRKEIDTVTAILRAAGLVGAKVDLVDAQNATQTADVVAFYSPDAKQIYVRTNAGFTVETRVTLAHELTHVLQDQHFDLNKIRKNADKSKTGSGDALTALIEGDAVRVQHSYLAEQSAKDRKEYDRLESAGANKAQVRTKKVPAIITTLFESPYVYGPEVINVLANAGGNSAIDSALTGPVPSTRIYLDPTAVSDPHSDLPPTPALNAGEKRVNLSSTNAESFDNFTFFVMLAARLDPTTALAAADAYQSGSEVLYSRNGVTCFRAAIDGINENATRVIALTLKAWTHALPSAAIETTNGPIVFHACDPGKRATTPNDRNLNDAVKITATRDGLVEGLLKGGGGEIPKPAAMCIARVLMQKADFRQTLLANTPETDAMKQEVTDAALTCHDNVNAGLP